MNRILTSGVAVASGMLLLADAAGAAMTFSTGDLMFGIRFADNSGKSYEVDLGSYSQFTHLDGLSFSLGGVSLADISGASAFGSTWNQTQAPGAPRINWGVIGYDDTTLAGKGNIFATSRRSDISIQSDPFANESIGTANSVIAQLSSLESSSSGGFRSLSATANSATAAFVNSSQANSFGARAGLLGNMSGTFYPFENGLDMSGQGSVVSDLYKVSTGGDSTLSQYLGYFTFGANGASFTAAVPEPSTMALAVLGGLAAWSVRRRNSGK